MRVTIKRVNVPCQVELLYELPSGRSDSVVWGGDSIEHALRRMEERGDYENVRIRRVKVIKQS